VNQTAKYEQTKQELDRLAYAVAGDPSKVSGGVRTDYGYVGDIGALPPNLDALAANPGGLATWNGPYIFDELTSGGGTNEYRSDAWGRPYQYSGGVTIVSSGGPSSLTREIAAGPGTLLNNRVSAVVVDLDLTPPGNVYKDSTLFVLTYPDGAGGMTSQVRYPGADGFAEFQSVPIGIHDLRLIYLPANDTLRRPINVNPGEDYYTEFQYYADVWRVGGGELEFVTGSDSLSTANCFKLSFWVINNSGGPISVSSLTLSWDSPTAYYKTVEWSGATVRSGNPALGSGDEANFTGPRVVANGESVQIVAEQFHSNPSGGGPPVDMTGAEFTVDFSNGTSITFTADECI
jgi:hypothetical protein